MKEKGRCRWVSACLSGREGSVHRDVLMMFGGLFFEEY